MTEQEKQTFQEKNPWKEVAATYKWNEKDCLFSLQKQYVCEGDSATIGNYPQYSRRALVGQSS